MTPLPPELAALEAAARAVISSQEKPTMHLDGERRFIARDDFQREATPETVLTLCALARQGSEDAARAEPTRTEPPLCYCGHPESHHVPMSLGSIVGGWHGCVSCLEAKTHCEMFDAARSTP